MNLLKKKKTESVNMHEVYIIIFLKKLAKGMNMLVKKMEIFLKKKNTKRVNMPVNEIEIFLKASTYHENIKSYFHLKSSVLLGKRERVFQELGK